jgi:hypothetical protein
VIGAMKAGTTSLYHYLRPHPEVFMPKVKELDFFAEEMNWSRGLDWYRRQFAPAPGDAVALGEASTVYSKFPRYTGVPARMAGAVPDVRLIYVVRDPIERIRSHYEHRVASGAETAPIESAVFENPIYLDYSRYALQIDQYLDYFPRDQLLVVTSEALRHERESTMREVYEFLGVAPDFRAPTLVQEFYKTEQRRTYPPLVWAARRTLKRCFPSTKRAKEWVDTRRRRKPDAPAAATATVERDDPISGPLRHQLEELLGGDVHRLRAHLGEPFDGWGIA